VIGLVWAGLLASALDSERILVAQLSIRSRIVVRVRTETPLPKPVELVEKKGPRCVPMGDVLGAAVIAGNSVDFILRGGARMRARFAASCPALDYYSGFYIAPPTDGMICADRDVVRARSGGECAIDRFRTLVPKKQKGR